MTARCSGYQSHQDCKTLICFVYDPSGKCTNPTALESDLTKEHDKLRVVVIVRLDGKVLQTERLQLGEDGRQITISVVYAEDEINPSRTK